MFNDTKKEHSTNSSSYGSSWQAEIQAKSTFRKTSHGFMDFNW